MPVTRGGIIPAIIQKARVLDVDISTYTMTIATEFAKKPMTSIPFATPYQHFVNGEGIYFMPEVGSLCWLCEPSDGGMPFVLAWAAGQDEADYTARKRQLNPGDIFLGTRDENFLILRRGGVVQLGATAVCQRIFLPVNNTINDFCENYGLHTLGGDLEWSIGRTKATTEGKLPAILKLYAKEFSNDEKPIAELEIGSHDEDKTTILTLVIRNKGGGEQKIRLSMTKEGDVIWSVKKDFSLTVEGDYLQEVFGDITVKGKKKLFVDITDDIDAKTGKNAKLEAKKVTVDSPLTETTGKVEAAGKTPVALAPPLLAWLGSHTHNIIKPTPGDPTSPPVAPPPGSIASQKLFSS